MPLGRFRENSTSAPCRQSPFTASAKRHAIRTIVKANLRGIRS